MWAGIDLLSFIPEHGWRWMLLLRSVLWRPEGFFQSPLALAGVRLWVAYGQCASQWPNLTNHVVISFPRNLDIIVSLPGGESLRGFILVTVLVEKAAVPGIMVFSSEHFFFFFNIMSYSRELYFPPSPFPYGELINIDEHRPCPIWFMSEKRGLSTSPPTEITPVSQLPWNLEWLFIYSTDKPSSE